MVQSWRLFMTTKVQQSPTWPFLGHTELGRHILASLKHKRLPSVVLFVGPRAVGKGSAASWLMRYSLCTAANNHPCERCPACRQTCTATHPNAVTLTSEDAATLGIEEIRQTLQTYQMASWGQSLRWLIIPDAERLTEAASNTMLKFLEELPANLHVVMTSSEPERMLSTLRSRATVYQWHFTSPRELSAVAERSAGRPGWMHIFQNAAAKQEDREQAAQTMAHFTSSASAKLERLPKDRAAIEEKMEAEELVVRDILLRSVGSQRRLLWPQVTLQSKVDSTAVVTLVKKYLDRYDLSPNLQSRLLYEDLHLV